MPETDAKTTALIAEGLTPGGRRKYLTSGGTNTEGLPVG